MQSWAKKKKKKNSNRKEYIRSEFLNQKKKISNRKEYLQFEFLIETVNNLYGLDKNKILTKMWLFIIKYL